MEEQEDLIENPFFVYIRSKCPALYAQIEAKCWSLCVPQKKALHQLRLTSEIIGAF
jgi:hypothetical protein